MPARSRTACRTLPATILAPSSKRAPASGATTPTRRDQVFSPKERYATGIRNGEGFDFDTAGRLYVTQHGRDQLHEDWPELYTAEQGCGASRRGGD